MRYVGQSYEVETPIPGGVLTADQLPLIEKEFHACHLKEFGVSSDDFDPAFVSFGVAAIGPMEDPPPVALTIGTDGSAIKGSSIKVDFTGTDPICQGAINSPRANTISAALYSLQFFLAPDAPQNQGMFNPTEVILPEGCWLNAQWPAPTIGCTTLTSSKITSAIWQALAKAVPEKITGSTGADANWFVASCTSSDGKTDVFSDLPASGWGGHPLRRWHERHDGPVG